MSKVEKLILNLFDVRFEAYGKDIMDSVKVNDWVADEILGYAGHSYLQILHTGSHHWVAVEIVKYTYMIASIK